MRMRQDFCERGIFGVNQRKRLSGLFIPATEKCKFKFSTIEKPNQQLEKCSIIHITFYFDAFAMSIEEPINNYTKFHKQ